MGQAMPKTAPNDPRATPNWPVLWERLWVTALALTRSRDDADDLTQQTFATLLAKQPGRVDHTAYARRTMVRLWLDQQRSLRRRLRRTARWALAARRWHVDSDRISEDERYERARQAIETLPPRQHAIAVLRLVEELDYGQIAVLLDCPVHAVRASLHVARERVRRFIGEPP
jgi:RNA polymerase sigma-70 factor (ECF subfamily)